MAQETFQGIGTVLAFLAFLGVCWWVYIAKKKSDFDEAANLPFADDLAEPSEDETASSDSDEKRL